MRKSIMKDPSSSQPLSASGIDFLLKILEVQPEKRLKTREALQHQWFINFTKKSTDNKKIKKFKMQYKIPSLNTILERNEVSELENS